MIYLLIRNLRFQMIFFYASDICILTYLSVFFYSLFNYFTYIHAWKNLISPMSLNNKLINVKGWTKIHISFKIIFIEPRNDELNRIEFCRTRAMSFSFQFQRIHCKRTRRYIDSHEKLSAKLSAKWVES